LSRAPINSESVNCAPEKGKRGKSGDKYSIREYERDKIVQKEEEIDKDGKTA